MPALNSVILALVLTVGTAVPLLAQDAGLANQQSIAEGGRTIGQTILGILAYVALPIAALYGIIRGGITLINGHEVGKGFLAVAAAIIIGLGPTILNSFFGIDVAQIAGAFSWK